KANSLYQFTIDRTNPATFGSKRFTLVIRQNPALAYHLLDFNAARIGSSSHVEVVWHTENEQNYTNFTVERSNDGGTTFDVVGGLQGTGAGNYSLVDKNALNGQNLYRLKQEDLNNTITYSKVVAVLIDGKGNKGGDNKLSIYPNPATNNISLAIAEQSAGNTSYSIRFMSSSGIMIKQITSSQPGWQGNISNLQPGTYLVRVINNKTQNLVGENKFVKL
ncbi:MAG: type sorting protein, partial [Mucilaginibacter sp.]|nr:type sorting protein [Mucilaginibacter sp.]